ncbi:unnamed protein product [Sphagnum tenellum]
MFALKFQMLQTKPIMIYFGIQSSFKNITTSAKTSSTAAAHFDSSQRTASIQEACRTAHYPEQCVVTLLSSHDSAAATSAEGYGATGSKYFSFAGAAMDSAVGGVSNFYSFTTRLSPEYGYEQWAQKSCLELLSSSQEEMYTSLSLLFNVNPANDNQGSVMTDILTSVSAALTYHTSCLDAWDYSPGSLRDSLLEQGNPVGVLLANAVSLVASVVEQQRASLTDDDGFPEWLRPGDRRILQATSNLTIVDATVAQDGTGQYTSIQQAVNAAPQLNPQRWVIQVGAGTYYENVVIPKNSTNLMFVGAGMGVTIITGSLSVIANNITTFLTATVAVNGHGFVARDLTIQNTAGADNHQAVALRVSNDQAAFYMCSIEGYQDTLYSHTHRQFYKNVTIYGTVDFVFGNAAAVFQNCNLYIRLPLSVQENTVTAQGRTIPQQNTGFSFQFCTIDAAPDLQAALNSQSSIQSYLGRPWKLYSRTVFLESYITQVIDPAGWLPWNGTFAFGTLFFGEYQNSGPGAVTTQRVYWSTQITDPNVAQQYTITNLIEVAEWLPEIDLTYQPSL